MGQLKQITRNATFAWSPARGKPFIASGTIAGAVDASFSQDSELEIWDLDLDNTDTNAFELIQPTAKITTERKFYSLAWGYVTPEKSRGVIAGAMDDGNLNLWDVNALMNNAGQQSLIASNEVHRGAIKAVEFNPVVPKLLMSAGSGGEIHIWDLENPVKPWNTPNKSKVDDIEAAAWNRKVGNIIATASTNGFTSVWDLKQSREILHLETPGRKRVSSIAWDPDNSTRVITGCGDDSSPYLHVWDLRNSNAPAQTLKGHSSGVLSAAWCSFDHNLLLSCGKDNRTILWNPQTGSILGEFPIASTWAFEVQWCPQNPDILANATFEGKVTIHRLQSKLSKTEMNGAQFDEAGEDFFSQRQYVAKGGFELKQAPKWLQVPCAASFGFGGSVVSVKNVKGRGDVKINKYISEPTISENASEFEEAIRTADWTAFCEKQIEKAPTLEEKGNWELLRLLFDSDPRKKLVEYLGIKEADVEAMLSEKVGGMKLDKTDSEVTAVAASSEGGVSEALEEPEFKTSDRLSGIFGSAENSDDFLSQLTPAPGKSFPRGTFSITSELDSESDKLITQAILFGRFDQAVDICLKEDRLADAFVLATKGDATVQKKVQDAYFSRNSQRASYLRLLQSIIDSNLKDIGEQADLSGWKQVLVAFCTFAKTDAEFADLCDILGRRLEEQNRVEDAKVCYLAGKRLDRVVNIWIAEADSQEKEELQKAEGNSAFSIHAKALQGFVEKVTVFQQTKGAAGGNLEQLYGKYTEFVEIVASQGNLAVAQKYVELLPGENEVVKTIKNRLARAMAVTATVAPTTPARAGPRTALPARGLPQPTATSFPAATAYVPMTRPSVAPPPSQQPYAPLTQAVPAAPVAPVAAPTAPVTGTQSRYAPLGPATTGMAPYTPAFAAQPYNPGLQNLGAPPPSRIADLPPPPKKTTENWNDPPMLANPVRTRTPINPAKAPSPFHGTSPAQSPGLPPPKPTPAPPPTTAKPPQRVKSPPISSPLTAQAAFSPAPQQGITSPSQINQSRPPPPPQGQFIPAQSQTPQPPPPPPPVGSVRAATSPPQSRPQYAPSPMQQQNSFPPPPSQAMYAPPPPARNLYARAPTTSPPPEAPTPPPQTRAAPPVPKYRMIPLSSQVDLAPGDRSHIPPSSRPVHDIFKGEMGRIKQVATSPQQKRIVADVDKRLNILFDLLNNDEEIPKPVISELVKVAEALARREFETALQIRLDLHTAHEQYATWMLGIKRLIEMAKALPI